MQNTTDEIRPSDQSVKKTRCSRGSTFICFVMILIFLALIAFNIVRTEQLRQILLPLHSQAKADMTVMKKDLVDLKQANEKSAELSDKQERMINEWQAAQKGDVEKWQVAEAQYLTKLANDHVQFTHNVVLALTLLQQADQILQAINDSALFDLRQALANDITNLKALPEVDVTGLYVRLSALSGQVVQLPLPASPLGVENGFVPTKTPANAAWWQSGLDRSWDALRKIVIVRKVGANDTPLVMPEEKTFLYQNLHAQLEDAMWGVLHRNNQVYQDSLARCVAWTKTYFLQEASETKNMLQSLAELQKENVEAPSASLSETLRLFDAYFVAQQR